MYPMWSGAPNCGLTAFDQKIIFMAVLFRLISSALFVVKLHKTELLPTNCAEKSEIPPV